VLGFYLADEPPHLRDSELAHDHWVYGDHHMHALTTMDDLAVDWRAEAEQQLQHLLTEHGPIWLVEMGTSENTWPELELAGGCAEHQAWPRGRLLLCTATPPF